MGKLLLIAGPCVIESGECLETVVAELTGLDSESLSTCPTGVRTNWVLEELIKGYYQS